MNIQEHVSLASYTTFMVQASARYFVSIDSLHDIENLMISEPWNMRRHYFLGSGSNTLFVDDYDGLVVVNQIKGLEVIEETEEVVIVRVGGGELWNDFVLWSVDQNLWGVENLVLIPGTVGAAPVQNIGAYGVEAKDTIHAVEAFDTETKQFLTFTNSECLFGYRTSMFKQFSGRYLITYVHFALNKNGEAKLSYPKIKETLDELGVINYTPQKIAETVITIRDLKLPRVGTVGTAGSFFENPVIESDKAKELLNRFPQMIQFATKEPTMIKLSAAWMIEYCGFKGFRDGKVGTYYHHALVLVNHGGAYGHEVWDFAQTIIDKVHTVFEVILKPEVQIVDIS